MITFEASRPPVVPNVATALPTIVQATLSDTLKHALEQGTIRPDRLLNEIPGAGGALRPIVASLSVLQGTSRDISPQITPVKIVHPDGTVTYAANLWRGSIADGEPAGTIYISEDGTTGKYVPPNGGPEKVVTLGENGQILGDYADATVAGHKMFYQRSDPRAVADGWKSERLP